MLVITEQVSAAFTLAVCRYPPLGKQHHKCKDFDNGKQQVLCYLVLTFPCRARGTHFPQLLGHSVQTRRCCLQAGVQSAISLVSVWDITKVFMQFIDQHISFQCTSVIESGFWMCPFEVNTKEYFYLAAPS